MRTLQVSLLACALLTGCSVDPEVPRVDEDRFSAQFFNELFAETEVAPASLGVVEIRIYHVALRGMFKEKTLAQEANQMARIVAPEVMRAVIHNFHWKNRTPRTDQVATAFRGRESRDPLEWHLIVENSAGAKTYARCIQSTRMPGVMEIRGLAPITYYVSCEMGELLEGIGVLNKVR
jgi:hypothetical protein